MRPFLEASRTVRATRPKWVILETSTGCMRVCGHAVSDDLKAGWVVVFFLWAGTIIRRNSIGSSCEPCCKALNVFFVCFSFLSFVFVCFLFLSFAFLSFLGGEFLEAPRGH